MVCGTRSSRLERKGTGAREEEELEVAVAVPRDGADAVARLHAEVHHLWCKV